MFMRVFARIKHLTHAPQFSVKLCIRLRLHLHRFPNLGYSIYQNLLDPTAPAHYCRLITSKGLLCSGWRVFVWTPHRRKDPVPYRPPGPAGGSRAPVSAIRGRRRLQGHPVRQWCWPSTINPRMPHPPLPAIRRPHPYHEVGGEAMRKWST